MRKKNAWARFPRIFIKFDENQRSTNPQNTSTNPG